MERTVEFEYFRSWLVEGLGYGDGSKGGRPPFDPVAMFKVLVLQARHNLSDARMEFMIRDRLSWMRFLGFSLGEQTPDENTIRHFRNRMTETGTLKRVMKAFDWQGIASPWNIERKGDFRGKWCPGPGPSSNRTAPRNGRFSFLFN